MAIPAAAMDPQTPTNEDCLYLNVWTPGPDDGKRSVLVWLHGGGYLEGAGSQSWYGGAALALRGDIVVVTINYRLGALGWLYLREAGGTFDETANLGLLDQIEALRWVQRNIAAFGGDAANVTLAGQSAGARSAAALLAMPGAAGLFHKAIVQSGNPHSHDADQATSFAEHVCEDVGLSLREAEKLRDVPVELLVDASNRASRRLASAGWKGTKARFQYVVDRVTLPEPPLDAIGNGSAADIPCLIGCTSDEARLWLTVDPQLRDIDEVRMIEKLGNAGVDPTHAEELVRAYRDGRAQRGESVDDFDVYCAIESDLDYGIPTLRLAEAQSRNQPKTYVSLFTFPSTDAQLGACHTLDLSFYFGTFDIPGMAEFVAATPEALELSDRIQAAWFAFMRTGTPQHPGLPHWPAFDGMDRSTMILDRDCTVQNDPRNDERKAWAGFLRSVAPR
jgi:para-nitrobenzyl esterase